MKKFLLCALVTALTTVGISLPAGAAGVGNPVVTAPADGASVGNGWSGPVAVNFASAAVGTYAAELWCDSGYDKYTSLDYDGTNDVQTWAIPAINGPASCSVTVDDGGGHATAANFSVSAPPLPPLLIDQTSISHAVFYPLVHDGYFDATAISYRTNRSATVWARARNSSGAVTRFVRLGTQAAGRHSWTWNGRKTDGSLAAPGNYRLEITAQADRTKTVAKTTTVRTAWRSKTVRKYRDGYDTSSSARTSSCYVDYYDFDATVEADCWGGSYAQVNYRLGIPSNAYNLSAYVNGAQGCCDEGVINKWGTRVSSTIYRISVKVTDWRSYTVNYVRVTYSYKYRV
jgi:FlgD Ig-like domain